jgi:hypothetical protein
MRSKGWEKSGFSKINKARSQVSGHEFTHAVQRSKEPLLAAAGRRATKWSDMNKSRKRSGVTEDTTT